MKNKFLVIVIFTIIPALLLAQAKDTLFVYGPGGPAEQKILYLFMAPVALRSNGRSCKNIFSKIFDTHKSNCRALS